MKTLPDEKATAVNWTPRRQDAEGRWPQAETTVTRISVSVWPKPASTHLRSPLAALTTPSADAKRAELRIGSRILLERDAAAEPATGAASPRFALVRAVGAERDDQTLVHVEWLRESAHAIGGIAQAEVPDTPSRPAGSRVRQGDYRPLPATHRQECGSGDENGERCMANLWRADRRWADRPGAAPDAINAPGRATARAADGPRRPAATLEVDATWAETTGLRPGDAIVLQRDADDTLESDARTSRFARVIATEAPDARGKMDLAVEWRRLPGRPGPADHERGDAERDYRKQKQVRLTEVESNSRTTGATSRSASTRTPSRCRQPSMTSVLVRPRHPRTPPLRTQHALPARGLARGGSSSPAPKY